MLDTENLRAWAEVDYSAIAHNIEEIRKLAGDTKIMGIVKADAYGHGDLACAKALKKAGIDFFAVACIEEAVALREEGIEDPILILGYTPPVQFENLAKYNITQSLLSLDFAKKLSQWAVENNQTVHAHVKLDTGMNRTGILYEENDQRFDELKEACQLPGLSVEGMFSHFPVADDLGAESEEFTLRQMELFDEAASRLKAEGIDPGLRHIQNTYGILNYGNRGYDYCRPGILYMGVTNGDGTVARQDLDVIPLLSLKTKVTMVKTIQPGASVSYGRNFRADSPRKIASLSIGYADGLPRACANKGLEVLIRGQRCKLVGNICMDQCMADVTDVEGVQEGDIVTIVGTDGSETVTIDAITRLAGTINYESLTRLTKRVPRIDVSL